MVSIGFLTKTYTAYDWGSSDPNGKVLLSTTPYTRY
jgi:hypothetical protein